MLQVPLPQKTLSLPASSNIPPLIIGHRGASALAPENTLAAFSRALDDGADGIEFDVRLSADEQPIVIHDATLKRTAGIKTALGDLPAAEIAEINAGSWFNRKFPKLAHASYEKQTVPTLNQVFRMFSSNNALLYLEMKCDDGGWDRLAKEVVTLIKRFRIANRTIVESFNLGAIKEIKRIDSNVRTAALFEPTVKRPKTLLRKLSAIELAQDCGADEIALHHSLVTSRVALKAAALKLPLVVWTVDDARWIQRALLWNIKALITNDPGRLIKVRDNSSSLTSTSTI